MIALNAIVTLVGMLASLAAVFALLEASSIALPAAFRRATGHVGPVDGPLSWTGRGPVGAVWGTASLASRKMHAALRRTSMNGRPIRQAA